MLCAWDEEGLVVWADGKQPDGGLRVSEFHGFVFLAGFLKTSCLEVFSGCWLK